MAAPSMMHGQGLHKMPSSLENKNLGPARRSTPDSEALMSSDDDHEPNPMSLSMHSAKSASAHRPIRRASWLSEVGTAQRKYSLSGMSLASAGGNSQPPTPLAENGHGTNSSVFGPPQGGGVTSGHERNERGSVSGSIGTPSSSQMWDSTQNSNNNRGAVASSNPWGNNQTTHIWAKKDFPRWDNFSSPSPLSQPAFDDLRSPTNSTLQDTTPSATSSGLPFDIPLEPNRKTVRSQSYSAGQLDPSGSFDNPLSSRSRLRKLPPGLARRPSKPILSQLKHTEDLHAVVEDDAETRSIGEISVPTWGSPRSETPPDLTPLSLQQSAPLTYQEVDDTMWRQDRRGSPPGTSLPQRVMTPSSSQSLSERYDAWYASQTQNGPRIRELLARAQPQQPVRSEVQPPVSSDIVTQLNVQAAATAAQNTIAQAEYEIAARGGHNVGTSTLLPRVARLHSEYERNSNDNQLQEPLNSNHENRYHPSQIRSHHFDPNASSGLSNDYLPINNEPYTLSGLPDVTPGVAGYTGGFDNRDYHQDHLSEELRQHGYQYIGTLVLVTFKSNRADIFYVPQTFISPPKPGDMVIVEGDRGQDMGMIQIVDMSVAEARMRKADYNKKHYKSLMQFSRMFQDVARASALDDRVPETFSGLNLGEQGRGRKDNDGEPKLLKRLATENEIRLLREKEGNEAKAKRICQGKVNSHSLNMEVLDAEFQLDYKKLTFYFYAEQYINFNEIVTDLFKVWKTRIWLSAVNPESYPAPTKNKQPRHQAQRSGQLEELRSTPQYALAMADLRASMYGDAHPPPRHQAPSQQGATNFFGRQPTPGRRHQPWVPPPGPVVTPGGVTTYWQTTMPPPPGPPRQTFQWPGAASTQSPVMAAPSRPSPGPQPHPPGPIGRGRGWPSSFGPMGQTQLPAPAATTTTAQEGNYPGLAQALGGRELPPAFVPRAQGGRDGSHAVPIRAPPSGGE